MPATAANVQAEKRASSAASPRSAHPLSSPTAGDANKARTRSAADAQAQAKNPTKYSDARKFLISVHLISENDACSTLTMANILRSLAMTYKMPENVSKTLGHVAEVLHHIEQKRSLDLNAKSLTDLIKEIQSNISAEMESKFTALESKLTHPSPAQKQLETTAKELGIAAVSIKASTDDIGKSIAQVTDTSSQLANTATNYKDALLRSSEQHTKTLTRGQGAPTQVDPKITRDIERKSRQILIDTTDPRISEASQAEIKEKVSTAISEIIDPPPPVDTTILDVNKLQKGGFTVTFKEKEVVNWLQDAGTELKFTACIAPDASITKRVYSILAPRIPTTFNPTNDEHLREMEECNNLPFGSIAKARWIKPVYRRAPGQRAAHAILAIKDVNLANTCIRDGMYICGVRTRPSRLKHEPMQCMKCRRWGHFAHDCTAPSNICGTCGEEHRTDQCTNKDKTFCVSCKTDAHPSWDRDCPEFRRRCGQYDDNYPKNSLPYFPTEEEWTLIPRPSRLQQEERFPARYEVSAYQHPTPTTRAPSNKHNGKQRRQQGNKVPGNQYTMDRFLGPGPRSTQGTDSGATTNNYPADAAAPAFQNPLPTHPLTGPGQEPDPHGWE